MDLTSPGSEEALKLDFEGVHMIEAGYFTAMLKPSGWVHPSMIRPPVSSLTSPHSGRISTFVASQHMYPNYGKTPLLMLSRSK